MGILVCDKEHKIVLSNIPIAEILGYENDEFLDRDITTLFSDGNIFIDLIENPQKEKFNSAIDLS